MSLYYTYGNEAVILNKFFLLLLMSCFSVSASSLKINEKVTVNLEEPTEEHPLELRVTLPSGEIQVLGSQDGDEIYSPDSVLSWISKDINHDGDLDIITDIPVAMVNSTSNVYLWDRHQFKRIEPNKYGSCNMLSNVQASNNEIISSCRGGPLWCRDVYKFSASDELHLVSKQTNNPGASSEYNILHFYYFDVSFDKNGKQISKVGATYDGVYQYTVKVAKLPLYNKPAEDHKLNAYLVKGDKVVITDVNDDSEWVKVKFADDKHSIEWWVKIQSTNEKSKLEWLEPQILSALIMPMAFYFE